MMNQDSELLCRAAALRVAQQMNGNQQAEVDPDTIRAWAELIFELLERCMALRRSAQGVEDAARAPGPFERLRVRAMARRSLGRQEFRVRGEQLIQALFDTAAASQPGEVANLADAVAGEVGG